MIRYKTLALSSMALLPFMISQAGMAAQSVNLRHQPINALQALIAAPTKSAATQGIQLHETKRSVGQNGTVHVRMQETYMGHPVFGAEGIVHIPHGAQGAPSLAGALAMAHQQQGSMNGTIYRDLHADLAQTPAVVFSPAQAQKALSTAVNNFTHRLGMKTNIHEQKSQLIVYVDKDKKAHWAYLVSFYADAAKEGLMPAKPMILMDAVTLKIFTQWDNIKTEEDTSTVIESGGGFGGNKKMGKVVYDGLQDHLAKLSISRDAELNVCYLKNDDVTVKSYRGKKVESYPCKQVDDEHNKVYWDGEEHAVNGGYSPDNDALFGGAVIKHMYQDWYGVPVLTQNGKPMMLNMVVHDPIDNAYWDGSKMTFGDGVRMFYPLTSLGVAAHEISHGFTEQHSNLSYSEQSGGMNESFSDMAAQAAEVYAYGKNSWQIGPEIFKNKDRALRYMDKPSKDCQGGTPGNWCSIDTAADYYDGLDVHYSSGVYNRFFYLMGTADGWDVKKAFDVMVNANVHYWTSGTDFQEGACGVMKAATDLGYDTSVIVSAAKEVGIDTSDC